jgi:sterol desaturase/sphingolipid hydroxylase (fatty acid hydroxylase superfamily)
MFTEFVLSGLLYGFLEYSLHRLAHIYNNKRHTTHHMVLKSDDDYRSSFIKSIKMFMYTSPFIYYYTIFRFLYIQYVLYEFTHSWIHWHISNRNSFVVEFIRYHNVHHAIHVKNFGVLTPFWDHVFGTMSITYKERTNNMIYLSFMPYFSFINFWCFQLFQKR